MTKKKFKITALGCRTNQYEAQALHDQMIAKGYELATADESADLCIVNTCTVTESADSSSRHTIRQLVRQNPGARVAVTGCYAERNPEAIKEIPGVTDIISNKDKEILLSKVYPEEEYPEFSIKRFDAHTRAFVKVQDGCNSYCTYCIIPYVRGRSKSRKMDEILNEVTNLVSNGYKEIVLTGINIGDFDGGSTVRLSDLIRAVDQVPGVERIRVSSIDPDEVDDDLADAILNGKNTCHSMHIVLQSGSNVVLKRMNRKYTRQMFMETIERLRTASRMFTFTTDVIVGFPGETDFDHEETLAVMREVKFAKVHMFPYSDRPRTKANTYPDKVRTDIINKRKLEVLCLAEKGAFELRESFIGNTMSILTENRESPEYITGHTANFLEVRVHNSHLVPNQLVTVNLTANSPDALLGKCP